MSAEAPRVCASQDPLMVEATVPVIEPLVRPIMAEYRELQGYILYAAYLSGSYLIFQEYLSTGQLLSHSQLYYALGILICMSAQVVFRHSDVSADSLRQYDIFFTSASVAFDCICCRIPSHNFDEVQALCASFVVPVGCIAQVHDSRIAFIFLSLHCLTCFFNPVVKHAWMGPIIIVCLFLAIAAYTKERVLKLAQVAEQRTHQNYAAIHQQVAVLRESRKQWRDLLERAFDGIVQLGDVGSICWANTKFWEQFELLQPGDLLRSSFTECDQLRFDTLCNPLRQDATDTYVRTVLTCDKGTSGWEFDCELVSVHPFDSGGVRQTLLGMRIMGEARPLNSQQISACSSNVMNPPTLISPANSDHEKNRCAKIRSASKHRRRKSQLPSLSSISETEPEHHIVWRRYFAHFVANQIIPRLPVQNRPYTWEFGFNGLCEIVEFLERVEPVAWGPRCQGHPCQRCEAGMHPGETNCFICSAPAQWPDT
eukprot:TRINITY_DN20347_c0_g2_i1.p1 TRINITY_DN20347_c0_g2~~TRINITY_DN20347_c0_g2_i1.p1  ORF type:complete len:483 (-),score=38.01 TRINITY_DN20347_c0_g2_i1:140-1588(-)